MRTNRGTLRSGRVQVQRIVAPVSLVGGVGDAVRI